MYIREVYGVFVCEVHVTGRFMLVNVVMMEYRQECSGECSGHGLQDRTLYLCW